MQAKPRVLWFEQIGIQDVAAVGGKNASLGEMYRELTPEGVRIPNGFAITAQAYWEFLRTAGLEQKLRNILTGLDTGNLEDLAERGRAAREAILGTPLPQEVVREICTAYAKLSEPYGAETDVAVRSSATAEDLPEASFAGQRKVGICGQAPSDYPEFGDFLVTCGIDSISLNPDTVLKTTQSILEMEKQLEERQERKA